MQQEMDLTFSLNGMEGEGEGEGEVHAFGVRPNQSEMRYYAADDSVYMKSRAVRLEVGENTAVGRAMMKSRVV